MSLSPTPLKTSSKYLSPARHQSSQEFVCPGHHHRRRRRRSKNGSRTVSSRHVSESNEVWVDGPLSSHRHREDKTEKQYENEKQEQKVSSRHQSLSRSHHDNCREKISICHENRSRNKKSNRKTDDLVLAMNGCRIIDDDAMSDGGQSVAVPDFPPTLKLEYYLQQLITVTKNQAEVPNALLQPN